MARHIVLLRGINVGGKNVLPMKTLTALCEGLGGQHVRTYIQSGNVALDLADDAVATFAQRLHDGIQQTLGLEVPVLLRASTALGVALAANPWPDRDPQFLSVAFLAAAPSPDQVARLDPQRSPPDEFQVFGDVVFLYTPNGFARTKLTNAWLDARLQTVSTVRNWRTVQTLADW